MLRLFSLQELLALGKPPATCLAIGVFDGVHRGHARLLQRTLELARQVDPPQNPLRSAVFTFQNNPLTHLRPTQAPPRLSTIERRLDWIEAIGLDLALAVPFDESIAHIEPLAFLKDVVIAGFGARRIVCGPDFHFGHHGAGNADFVRKVGPTIGLDIEQVPPMLHLDAPISSSRIRRLIIEGHVDEAAELLGRPHEIEGTVVPGKKRGRQIGYPTANLEIPPRLALPRTGVYAVVVEHPGGLCGGMMNVGYSPTFGDIEEVRLEAHLFDFSGDLTGKRLRVRLLKFLREEKRFASVAELVEQLRLDEREARAIAQASLSGGQD